MAPKSSELLKEHLRLKKARNPRYSLRALAARLKISPAFLSKILSGKKALPVARLSAIARELELDSYARRALEKAVYEEQNLLTEATRASLDFHSADSKSSFEELTVSHDLFLLEDWYYLPILELVTCAGFTPAQIPTRLGLKENVAEFAWRRLLAQGLVIEKDGRWQKANKQLRLSVGGFDQRLQNHHVRMLRKAGEEVAKPGEENFARRLATGASVATNEKSFNQAMKYLEGALVQAGKILASGKPDQVYYLAMQLFPLSNKP